MILRFLERQNPKYSGRPSGYQAHERFGCGGPASLPTYIMVGPGWQTRQGCPEAQPEQPPEAIAATLAFDSREFKARIFLQVGGGALTADRPQT